MANVKNWRTSLGGACAALGTFLFGAAVLFNAAGFEIPSSFVKACMMVGFIMQGAGVFLMALLAADKKVVENNLKEQQGINLEELGINPPPEKKP